MTAKPNSFDDEAALLACARDERYALRALYEREGRWLLGVAQRIVRDRARAEDVLQDAFLEVWLRASTYQPALGSARGWICTVVRHRALKDVRDASRSPSIEMTTPEDRLATASDDVLGTLSTADAATVDAMLPDDPALLRDIYGWQDRLLALSARIPPQEPSTVLGRRVEVAVDAPPRSVDVARPALLPWWRRAMPWQVIGGLALASAAGLATLLVQRATVPDRDHDLAVLQSPTDRTNGWIVDVRAGGTLRPTPAAGQPPVPAGRSLQFWTKPQDASAPTSLGLVHAGEPLEMPVSTLPGVGEQQLFEITLEPEQGSPIGKPTGPILYVGRTVHL